MTPELTYLLYAVILLIAHIIVQATFSDLSKGLLWALGPQDEPREQNVIADRVQRALRNYLETFAAFAALALILAVTERGTALSATGAALYFWARLAYIPAFASGIPLGRSITWFVSMAGLVMMLIPAMSGP
ncbi:MAG: MAPEG family protein [Pseudomonadota bacterium]